MLPPVSPHPRTPRNPQLYVIRKPGWLSANRLLPGQKPATAGAPPVLRRRSAARRLGL